MGYWIVFAAKKRKPAAATRPASGGGAAYASSTPRPGFCSACGAPLSNTAAFCSACGKKVEPAENSGASANDPAAYNTSSPQQLQATTGMKLLCFFIPLAGIILYCVHITDSPQSAKTCLHFTLGGIAFWVVISILLTLIPYLILYILL